MCSLLRAPVNTILHYPVPDAAWQNCGMDIRDRIRACIDENPELTVRSVSLAAGLSDSMLHKFLSGGTDSITLKTVDKIAEALGVDAQWLAYGEGSPERASDLTKMWERIAENDRDKAMRVLEAFARTGTDG